MSKRTAAVVEREIAKLREEHEKLLVEEAAYAKMPLDQQAAITLHSNCCHSDHTEACGWYYEVTRNEHDWNGSTHRHWLSRANAVIANLKVSAPDLPRDQYIAVIEATSAR